jgi:uncharacterized membrane protein (DUF4010 family)
VDLVYGYPAILIGLAGGLVAAWRSWPISPILAVGAITFAVLVIHQATVPAQASEEGNVVTAPLWTLLAVVNIGSWALGIAMGVAVAGLRRHAHPQ